MFGRKSKPPLLTPGQQAHELAWSFLRLLDSPELLQMRTFLARAPYSDAVRYMTISGYLLVTSRVPEAAEDFRRTALKLEDTEDPEQVSLIPVVRSALAVLDLGSLSHLTIESRVQADYLMFMLGSRLIQSPEAFAQLKALDNSGYWDMHVPL